MKDKFFFDLGRIMDDIFGVARDFGENFGKGFPFEWDDSVDYYPAYSYPPANIYITPEKKLVFEFAMSGFQKDQIGLTFQGDYMILSAKANIKPEQYKDVKFFKRRLKLKEIDGQKYYVPADKFYREKVNASFKNGLLTIIVPPNDDPGRQDEINIDITGEEE